PLSDTASGLRQNPVQALAFANVAGIENQGARAAFLVGGPVMPVQKFIINPVSEDTIVVLGRDGLQMWKEAGRNQIDTPCPPQCLALEQAEARQKHAQR